MKAVTANESLGIHHRSGVSLFLLLGFLKLPLTPRTGLGMS
jgi:hypothetical protein